MVHWNELSDFLKSNPFQTYNVKTLELLVPGQKGVDHFPILADTPLAPAPVVAEEAHPITNLFTPTPVLNLAPKPLKTPKIHIQKHTLDPIVFGIEMIDIL